MDVGRRPRRTGPRQNTGPVTAVRRQPGNGSRFNVLNDVGDAIDRVDVQANPPQPLNANRDKPNTPRSPRVLTKDHVGSSSQNPQSSRESSPCRLSIIEVCQVGESGIDSIQQPDMQVMSDPLVPAPISNKLDPTKHSAVQVVKDTSMTESTSHQIAAVTSADRRGGGCFIWS